MPAITAEELLAPTLVTSSHAHDMGGIHLIATLGLK